tara:strand:- start:748 stop:5937 length:5190 start_codon:yes stop_codon:yes gene_type:complete
MAPFDSNWSPSLINKVSTQIDGQLPEFIAADHPNFSNFLKSYYKYLESGELRLTVDIDNVLLELDTASNLLREDGGLIVTESGAGTTGKFVAAETITGGTSNATAEVLVEDLGHATKPRLFITSQQKFETGETVTGGTSGATGTVTQYRASPVQNIQQLLAYADIDNTIYDFIEQFRESFMNAIPNKLATGLEKRNLVKNIRELYRRKGTKEAAKLFMRILLDVDADVFYPNQYMLRPSDSDWDEPTIIRCEPVDAIATGSDLIGQTITGATSDATALIEDSTLFAIGAGVSYTEFQISPIEGTFVTDEIISGVSSSLDATIKFTIRQIFSAAPITNDGILYSDNDVIDLDSSSAFGSGDVNARINGVKRGSVSGVVVDDGGTNYEVGDLVVFPDHSDEDGGTQTALGKVAVIHGSILDETDSDRIIQEDGSNEFVEYYNVELERGTYEAEEPYAVLGTNTDTSITQGYYYPIYTSLINATEATINKAKATVNGVVLTSKTVALDTNVNTIVTGMRVRGTNISAGSNVTVSAIASQSSITLSETVALSNNDVLTFESLPTTINSYTFLEYPGITFYSPKSDIQTVQGSYDSTTYTLWGGDYNFPMNNLYSESGNAASYTGDINTEAVMGDRLEFESSIYVETLDIDRNNNDGFMLEEYSSGETTPGAGDATRQAGDITLVRVFETGKGYSKLPTTSIKTRYGSGANILATTTDIGRAQSVNISNPGFNYSEAPTLDFRANFVVKDVTGTFTLADTLTSHTGTVRGYDTTTQVLSVSLEDRIRATSEGNTEEGIRLEDNLTDTQYTDSNITLNGAIVTGDNFIYEDGDNVVLNSSYAYTDYILLEDDQGELVMEFAERRLSQITLETGTLQLQSGTGDAGVLISENYDYIVSESETTEFLTGPRQIKFVQESSNPSLQYGAGDRLVFNSSVETVGEIILNGTDASSTNAGAKIIFNAIDASGTNDPSNLIVMESGLTNDVNNILLQDTDDFDDVALDGTNSSSLHAGYAVLHEDTGIDFSAGTTTISTATASATIVNADVAKATSTIGLTTTKKGVYSGIESLIGESLIRIQDSYYYQQFAYEVQTNASTPSYMDSLKKATHPAGFNVFGKVLLTTSVSMALQTTGAELGDEYVADTSTFTPILASTFETLFGETVQRRLGIRTEPDSDILLEDSVIIIEGDEIVLEIGSIIIEAGGTDGDGTNAGDNIILNGTDSSSTDANRVIIIEAYSHDIGDSIELETAQYAYIDFEAIQIESSVESGSIGNLITNAGDRIVSESQEAISNRIVFNGTNDAHIFQADAGGQITLEDDSGSAIIESSISEGIGNFELESGLEGNRNSPLTNRLIDETSSIPFVTDDSTSPGRDVFVTSEIVTKLSATLNQTHSTASGLAFLIENTTAGITGDRIELESGYTQRGSYLLLTGTDSDGTNMGDDVLLESGADVNVDQSIVLNFERILLSGTDSSSTDAGSNIRLESESGGIGTLLNESGAGRALLPANDSIVLNGTDGSSSNAGEDLVLENPAGRHGGGKILGENIESESFNTSDTSRNAHVNISDNTGNNDDDVVSIILEGDEVGTFKQEDETTVSTTFGDDILLEYKTGLQVGGKLQLERTPIILEDAVNDGAKPFGIYGDSTIEPLTHPADIFVKAIGKISTEDYFSSDLKIIFNGTDASSTDAGDEILIEDGTYQAVLNTITVNPNLGWSGTAATGGITFDNGSIDFSQDRIIAV